MNKLSGLRRRLGTTWNRLLARLMVPETVPATGRGMSSRSYGELASTLNAIPDLMFELDADGRHRDFRALRPELLVAPPDQLLGHTVSEVMPDEAAKAVMQALRDTMRNGYSHGTHIHLPTGIGKRWFEVSMARKEEIPGEEPRFIVLSRDITERKEKELETERLAFVDPLTRLPNRHLLKERLGQAVHTSEQSGTHVALLFLDLDNFKDLNDSRGHAAGDQLLTLVAKRLSAATRAEDMVARWGGDEFIVLAPGLSSDRDTAKRQAGTICVQLLERLRTPYALDGYEFSCVPSIGVNVFMGSSQDIEDIIRLADTAMYTCKRSAHTDHVIADPPA